MKRKLVVLSVLLGFGLLPAFPVAKSQADSNCALLSGCNYFICACYEACGDAGVAIAVCHYEICECNGE